MSWTDTHRRWQILRDIEAELALDPGRALDWRPDYAPVFTDRAELVAFLRYRWALRVQAQIDPYLHETVYDERHLALASAWAGLRRLDREAADALAS